MAVVGDGDVGSLKYFLHSFEGVGGATSPQICANILHNSEEGGMGSGGAITRTEPNVRRDYMEIIYFSII